MRNTLNSDRPDRRTTLAALVASVVALPLLAACAAPRQRSSAQALDDASSELTPAYVVTHTSGRPTMFVRANYFSWDRKQDVELRPDARLTVNGQALTEDPKAVLSYIADVPARPTIEYVLVRRPGQAALSHTLELPYLQIDSMPRVYREGGEFPVALRPGPRPGPGVIEDHVNMTIKGPQGETRLERVEGSDWSKVTLVPFQRSTLPPGDYHARIYRQQRVSLNRMSSSRTGWAVISHGFEFVLAVR